MVLATDVAHFIIKAAKVGGIYNLTDGIHPTLLELSNVIAQKIGKSTPPNLPKLVAKFAAKIGDLYGENFPINTIKYNKIISTLTFDDSKARNTFDWKPTPILSTKFT